MINNNKVQYCKNCCSEPNCNNIITLYYNIKAEKVIWINFKPIT